MQRFAGQSSVRTWLIGILKHKIVDSIRKATRERPFDLTGDEAGSVELDAFFESDGHFTEPPGEWDSPEKALDERRFFEALERCLQALPKNTASAFTMRELLGLETEEICKELGFLRPIAGSCCIAPVRVCGPAWNGLGPDGRLRRWMRESSQYVDPSFVQGG